MSTLPKLSIHEKLCCKKANVLINWYKVVKISPALFLFYEFVIHSHHILGQHELNSCPGATRFSLWRLHIIPDSITAEKEHAIQICLFTLDSTQEIYISSDSQGTSL